MNWYLKVLRQYFDFSGRARRKEYWYFLLFNLIVTIGVLFVDYSLGTVSEITQFSSNTVADEQARASVVTTQFGLFSTLYSLFVFIPSLAVSVRRLHDIGRTGWWLLIALVPLVGFIVLLVFYVTDSESGTNKYGPNPKSEST